MVPGASTAATGGTDEIYDFIYENGVFAMINDTNRKFKRGTEVAITAEMVYQLTGSNMSSPQTAEMNAPARAGTISKWVKITHWEAVGWTAFFMWLYGSWWPAVGGILSWSGMYGKYRYAISSGLRNGGPPTENYKDPTAPYKQNGYRGRSPARPR